MSGAASAVWGILFPRKCILCGEILPDGAGDLCCKCQRDAPVYPFGREKSEKGGKKDAHFLDSFTAVWYYEGDVRRSILRFKFRGASFLASRFARCMAEKLRADGSDFDILSWVPVSRRRQLRRGYDQCAMVSGHVAKELGTVSRRTLRKRRHTPPQSSMSSASMRKANILGAYTLEKGVDVAGKRILLIDDIFTTGATMNECARVLLSAGAAEVHGAVLATVRNHKSTR